MEEMWWKEGMAGVEKEKKEGSTGFGRAELLG